MTRTAINPVFRAKGLCNQGEVIAAPCRFLCIADQVSVRPDGDAPVSVAVPRPGDMRAPMAEAPDSSDADRPRGRFKPFARWTNGRSCTRIHAGSNG